MTDTLVRSFERRPFTLRDVEIRAAGGKQSKLEFTGRAIVYGQLSVDLGGWQEIIDNHAATRTLANNPDVRFLLNHNAGQVLGRTAAGTLTLTEDDEGVRVESSMADVSYARDIAVSMERGDVNQMSFGFWIMSDAWAGMVHHVREIDLDDGDVSIVTYPAFPQTSAELNSRAQRHLRALSGPSTVPNGDPPVANGQFERTRAQRRRELELMHMTAQM